MKLFFRKELKLKLKSFPISSLKPDIQEVILMKDDQIYMKKHSNYLISYIKA